MKYKTGELAKKANVSVRTIRYYDSISLLSPSDYLDNGYRVYNDGDYFKLQKILCLKSLGFDLEEIRAMTATDSYTTMNEAINYQIRSIDQQIRNLKELRENLLEVAQSMESSKEVEWPDIVQNLKLNLLNQGIQEQYKNSTNIDIRIKLHRLYSTNPESWYSWVYSRLGLEEGMKVLEIGCGNGQLFIENKDRLKGEIILSDISQGMIDAARDSLGECIADYAVFDAKEIPYEDESFDVIIADHMLFYARDLDAVLKETYRVLKKGGVLYASTYGPNHMKENTELVKEFDPRITLSSISLYEIFGLDNGREILGRYFPSVSLERYEDHLEVTDPNDLMNYILSCHGNQNEYIGENIETFRRFVARRFKKGSFYISKDAGLFSAKKN